MHAATKMAKREATWGRTPLNRINDPRPRTADPERQGEVALALRSKDLKIPVCSYPQGNVGTWSQRQGSGVPGCPPPLPETLAFSSREAAGHSHSVPTLWALEDGTCHLYLVLHLPQPKRHRIRG